MIGMRVILSAIDRHLLWIPSAFRVVAGALAVGAAIRWVLEQASSVHLVFAGVLAVAFIAVALWLTHLVRRTRCPADCTGALGILALGLLTTLVVSAWASFAIQTSGIGSYVVPDGYSPSTFVDFYMYVFADIMPGMEPLRTLRIAMAVEPQDWVAGLPVLGFKLYVLWLFVGAYRSWWRATKRAAA